MINTRLDIDNNIVFCLFERMSYHLMGGQRPSYESIGQTNYPSQFVPNPLFPQVQPNTSVALFHIPNDSTNSLYVDGIPNDAS